MGVDVYARVAVGYRIPRNQVATVVPSSCFHSKPSGAQFCPTCGVSVKKERREYRLEDSEEVGPDNAKVVKYGDCSEMDFAVGILSRQTRSLLEGGNGAVASLALDSLPEDLDAYAERLRTALAERGIVVERADFGVHTLVTVYY